MNKLVAVFSSVAVCVSAVAVSVLSYFSQPVETDATAPDTTSLTTTTLLDSGTFPTITIPQGALINATGDFYFSVSFCPTGWSSSSSYVSPSSYGTYSGSSRITFQFWWLNASQRMQLWTFVNFNSGLAGQKVFSKLLLADINGTGSIPSQDFLISRVSPTNSANSLNSSIDGLPITPSALPSDVVYTLTGIIGNDYDLWYSSIAYQGGYDDGNADGYDNGYSGGYSVGVHDASSQFGMWDLFSNAFTSVGNVLGIQIFPGLTVGLLISVPIAFAFILWLIHVLKG